MARLDQERQARLEPKRMIVAINELSKLGFTVKQMGKTKIEFIHRGYRVIYFPYSGWATGPNIKDGRGLKNLLEQLKD